MAFIESFCAIGGKNCLVTLPNQHYNLTKVIKKSDELMPCAPLYFFLLTFVEKRIDGHYHLLEY